MLEIHVLSIGPIATNCYIVRDRRDRAFLIDPGCDWQPILDAVRGFDVSDILITHAHWDHIGGVAALKHATGAKLWAPRLESDWLGDPSLNLSATTRFWPHPVTAPPADELLDGGERIELLGEEIQVLSTPGHSPGHLSFRMGDVVFGGDALFAGSIGRTDLPGGDLEVLLRSIREQLLSLPSETTLLPGHGPSTTIGEEIETNPFLQL